MIKATKKVIHKSRWYIYLASVLFLLVTIALLAGKVTNLSGHITNFQKLEGIFTYRGSTYVKYEELPIDVQIFTAASCVSCRDKVEKLESTLRRYIPTLANVDVINIDTKEGGEKAATFGFGYVPAIVFPEGIVYTEFYEDAKEFFAESDSGDYVLYAHALGIDPGKHIGSPNEEIALTETKEGADMPIYMFTDVSCPSCKTMYDAVGLLQKTYASNVRVHTFLTAEGDETSQKIIKGYYCASRQEKGLVYADHIFARQAAWLTVKDLDAVLLAYARTIKLNEEQYVACMQEDHDAANTNEHDVEFDRFGITKVPTIMIDGEVYEGVQPYADLKKIIDTKIKK